MNRLIIVSNRLPVSIQKNNDDLTVIPSSGGLATALHSYHRSSDSVWIGWPGVDAESDADKKNVTRLLAREQCLPVFLGGQLLDDYYHGFSNTTLWPLFHYFAQFTEFSTRHFEAYRQVNELFAEEVLKNASANDTVWIHDYQLLLLPNILKQKQPDLHIGFFLHIPFPSFEMFRILPWREEILSGMLGADLIGFHTYDYARHFISSAQRLLGYDAEFNTITTDDRQVFVDVFPMGIDYEKFQSHAIAVQSKPVQERSREHQDIDRFLLSKPDRQLILSIDRLDYTKGIPERIHAFRRFLHKHPRYLEKVSLIMLTVPSRVAVAQYQNLRSEVEELVGSVNGEFGTMGWTPIIYFYRTVPFQHLIELYCSADVALLTPLRDGMNLVAKEYIATKTNLKGVLILSEMAGSAKELGEAISVNPNNIEDVSDAIHRALTMPVEEQRYAVSTMQERLQRYDIHKWASEFVTALSKSQQKLAEHQARKMSEVLLAEMQQSYMNSQHRVLFLDYDGTLQRFFGNPQDAMPDEALIALLRRINSDERNRLVLVSGRDRETLHNWFGALGFTLIAEHGAWFKFGSGEWILRNRNNSEWKENIRPILDSYVDRTPGSLIEEKTHSLVWHYRKSDIVLGELRARELKTDLSNLLINQDLEVLEGSKVVEVKVTGINKGNAALEILQSETPDFLLAIGDDWTDEYLFKSLPDNAITFKVGTDRSAARYYVDNYKQVRTLLKSLLENSDN